MYDHILLLNDSILLPINGIDNFKNTIKKMRETSDFWVHFESNVIELNLIPIEFKYNLIHCIILFLNNNLLNLKPNNERKNINIIYNLQMYFVSNLSNKGYKYNIVMNELNNNLNTFAVYLDEYYLCNDSPYLNYLTRFL